MGGSATTAGTVLTPLFLGWVITSVISARLMLHIGYRSMTVVGIVLMAMGFGGLATLDASSSHTYLLVIAFTLGGGMGFAMLALLLAMQHAVGRSMLGLATSMNQFSRSVGAALGVSMMGAILGSVGRRKRHAAARGRIGGALRSGDCRATGVGAAPGVLDRHGDCGRGAGSGVLPTGRGLSCGRPSRSRGAVAGCGDDEPRAGRRAGGCRARIAAAACQSSLIGSRVQNTKSVTAGTAPPERSSCAIWPR